MDPQYFLKSSFGTYRKVTQEEYRKTYTAAQGNPNKLEDFTAKYCRGIVCNNKAELKEKIEANLLDALTFLSNAHTVVRDKGSDYFSGVGVLLRDTLSLVAAMDR